MSNTSTMECTCPQHGRWLAAEDVYQMVKELDVAMNGKDAAIQPTLCDIVPQLLERIERIKHMPPSVPVSELMYLRNQCYAVYTAKEIKTHSQFEKGYEMANRTAYHDFVDELDSLIKKFTPDPQP